MKHSAKSRIFCQNIVYYQSRRWLCEFSLSCLVINYCFIASIVVSGEQVLQAGIVPLSSWKLQPFFLLLPCRQLNKVRIIPKLFCFRKQQPRIHVGEIIETSFPSSLESLNSFPVHWVLFFLTVLQTYLILFSYFLPHQLPLPLWSQSTGIIIFFIYSLKAIPDTPGRHVKPWRTGGNKPENGCNLQESSPFTGAAALLCALIQPWR